MADYIDKEQLKNSVKRYFKHLIDKGKYEIDILDANAEINRIINQTPPAEVFPVVYCKDCECQSEVWEDEDTWEGKNFCPVIRDWVEQDDYCYPHKRGEEDDTV